MGYDRRKQKEQLPKNNAKKNRNQNHGQKSQNNQNGKNNQNRKNSQSGQFGKQIRPYSELDALLTDDEKNVLQSLENSQNILRNNSYGYNQLPHHVSEYGGASFDLKVRMRLRVVCVWCVWST